MVARTTPTVVTKPEPPTWVTVLCTNCGRKVCEVSPGSAVKIVCKRCKKEVIARAA